MNQSIEGFDYRLQKRVVRSSREWRETLREMIANGARRQVENGETFVFQQAELVIEIYSNIRP